MIISANYQALYYFSREWTLSYNQVQGNASTNNFLDYQQKGYLSAIGLAYCIQITPTFSMGGTWNIWEDRFEDIGWEEEIIDKTNVHTSYGTDFVYSPCRFHRYTFSG